jgi:DNA-binding NarL/FixJ family response regulator
VAEGALTVVAIEDDPRFRASLASLLQSLPEVRLIATYPAATPMLNAAERAHTRGDPAPCDVVLMDLGLPDVSGIDATRRLKTFFPGLHVVALTVFEDPKTILEAICSGVDSYILKEASADELLDQLRLVARNGATISPRLAGTVLKLMRVIGGKSQTAPAVRNLGLTERQLDVLRALSEGRSYRETGEVLGISVDTVRSHIRHTYAALQVRSAAHAVSQALSRGLL